jgi:hypothetical protein
MEHPDLDTLPRAYRIGLLLHEMGADDDLIGECLGIDPAGVSTLIEIGRQKLAAASDPDDSSALPIRTRTRGPQRVIPDDSVPRDVLVSQPIRPQLRFSAHHETASKIQ